jgi:hypothetical protein
MDCLLVISVLLREAHDAIRECNITLNLIKTKEVKVLDTALWICIQADLVFIYKAFESRSVSKNIVMLVIV